MEKLKKMLVMLLTLCILVSQCTFVQAAAKKPPKYAITMNKNIYTMKKGKTVVLKAALSKAASKKKIVWSSSSKQVATVSPFGKVTAKKVGNTTVTAKIKGTNTKTVCKITVGAPVEKVKLAKSSISIKEGVYYKVNVAFKPKKPSNVNLIYSSDDTSVATINASGVIKAVSEGETKITVMAADGTKKAASCKVEVKAKDVKPPKTQPTEPNPPQTVPTDTKPTPPSTETKPPSTETKPPSTETKPPSTETKPPSTEKPSTEVEVSSVTLDENAISLVIGREKKLTASVTPTNAAKQEITWKTSDKELISVDNSGNVKALKEGTAAVTATAANGKEAVCAVQVLPHENISTQTELEEALLNETCKKIVYQTDAADAIEVPAGDYTDKILEINAPNGDVTNNGKFEKVVIYAIASDTYVENAENTIEFKAAQGHIEVSSTGTAAILLTGSNSQQLHLSNNGTVTELNVPDKASLHIDGSNAVPVTLAAGAEGTDIQTSVKLNIVSDTSWEMSVLPGAEHTRATVDNRSCLPAVYGVGRIPVTVSDERDIVNLPAVMRNSLGINRTVSIKGKIMQNNLNDTQLVKVDSDGAGIFLIPYTTPEFNKDAELAGLKPDSVPLVTTDDSGNYEIKDVTIGNYWMFVTKSGCKSAVMNICITSLSAAVYSNAGITLLQSELYNSVDATSISGTVIDGSTGRSVNAAGIQVKLRAGNGNIVGPDFTLRTMTDDGGKYKFETNIPVGIYTIEVVDTRELPEGEKNYNQANTDIVVAPGHLSTENYNCIVNPQMSSGDGQNRLQFTLRWGTMESGASADIDSHLWGPSLDGNGEFHTWFGNKIYAEAGERTVDLDVDDVTYEGPEHTTIYKKTDGIYRFYIHNFSESSASNSDMLSKSSVQVEFVVGEDTYVFNCPNQLGNIWYVCDYDSTTGSVTERGEMSSGYADEVGRIR